MNKIDLNSKEWKLTILLVGSFLSFEISGRFRSYSRSLFYYLHKMRIVNLNNINTTDSSHFNVCSVLDESFKIKFKKKDIYELIGLSLNTFNKYFESEIKERGFKGRKTFTLVETYHLAKFWFGNAAILPIRAIKKGDLAKAFHNSDYKMVAQEFVRFLHSKEQYKNQDLISPSVFNYFCNHVGIDEDEKIEFIESLEDQWEI